MAKTNKSNRPKGRNWHAVAAHLRSGSGAMQSRRNGGKVYRRNPKHKGATNV